MKNAKHVALACVATLLCLGCTPAPDFDPLLTLNTELQTKTAEMLAAIDAGELKQADGLMHDMPSMLTALEKATGVAQLSAAGSATISDASRKIVEGLRVLHDPVCSGSGDFTGIDVDAVTQDINAALESIQDAILAESPSGIAIPSTSVNEEPAEGTAEQSSPDAASDADAPQDDAADAPPAAATP
ncbi:MAG: hypothetical protein AAF790_03890 [Planctomycetota bacterium]